MKKDAEMYAGCVSGASEMTEYLKIIENSGFFNVKFTTKGDKTPRLIIV